MNTLAWYDLWGKILGYSVLEYMCMPIGFLADLIDLYLAREGVVEVRDARKMLDDGIPTELR